MPALRVEDVHCSYGSVRALRGVTLAAEEASVVCILGANGAGKSTMLKTIAGLVRPRAGRVRYDSRGITALSAERRLALGIALCPEGRQVFPDFTVRENLEIGGYRLSRRRRASRVTQMTKLFPALEDRLGQRADSLSGGEQQMLAIGRALMTEPSLLLLDEPSLGLAPLITQRVFEAIRQIRESGTTVVIVEQNSAVLGLAEYAYVLANGQLELEGPAARLRDSDLLRRAYLGG